MIFKSPYVYDTYDPDLVPKEARRPIYERKLKVARAVSKSKFFEAELSEELIIWLAKHLSRKEAIKLFIK